MTRPAAAGHSESPPAVARSLAVRAQRGPRRRDRASRMRPDLSRPAAESSTVARRAFRGRRQWQRTRADLPATGSGCAETRGRRFVTIWSNVRSRGRRRDSHYDKGELRCSLPPCDSSECVVVVSIVGTTTNILGLCGRLEAGATP
jgi:hypothetical protein